MVATWLWTSPLGVLGWCLLVFVPCRIFLGGANYLPSKAWHALSFIIPGFVVVGLLPSAFCIPFEFDMPTLFHVIVTLLYFQLDLGLGRWLTGPAFGQISVPMMVARELSPCPSDDSRTLAAKIKRKVPAPAFAKAPLFDFFWDFVSVTAHEVFWNVFICQNCLDHGAPLITAILAVPAVSCLVHGIVTSASVGLRMFPQFLHVALAFYSSGSILPPALIHQLWYVLDQKTLAVVKQGKREWDIDERRDEASLTPWDVYSTASLVLTLCFYLPLELLVHRYPVLYSFNGLRSATTSCQPGRLPSSAFEWGFITFVCLRIAMQIMMWKTKRVAYDKFLATAGDGTEQNQLVIADAMLEFYNQKKRAASAREIGYEALS